MTRNEALAGLAYPLISLALATAAWTVHGTPRVLLAGTAFVVGVCALSRLAWRRYHR
jgi:hypothetical protein